PPARPGGGRTAGPEPRRLLRHPAGSRDSGARRALADLVQARVVKDWLRSPALHFLLIGGLLFAAHARWRRVSGAGEVQAEVPKTIVISAAEIAQLRRQWYAQSGRLPDPGELRAAIDHALAEEVLYCEALVRALDRDDEVIRQRLVRVVGFLCGCA